MLYPIDSSISDSSTSQKLKLWWQHWRLTRERVRHEAEALHQQYGPAAAIIARNSARQPVGFESRRFWRRVARELSRARYHAS
jgi:hypothetical protein